jgi:hypothetical protein
MSQLRHTQQQLSVDHQVLVHHFSFSFASAAAGRQERTMDDSVQFAAGLVMCVTRREV